MLSFSDFQILIQLEGTAMYFPVKYNSVILENLTVASVGKPLQALHGTQEFITKFIVVPELNHCDILFLNSFWYLPEQRIWLWHHEVNSVLQLVFFSILRGENYRAKALQDLYI
jgi:hypothetical protein